jgi:ubiquinone/menaquinone biosynthesis C-methylase UbiE
VGNLSPRLYEFLIENKFRAGLAVLGVDIAGMSVLEVCCGSGMMAEKFARTGARVTGTDFSPAAIARARKRAQRYRFDATFVVADAENLTFADHSFDIVAVHDGLHYLDSPERAIREMARVARRGVLILDPAQAALTKVAVWLGLAVEVEEAGSPVKRLDPKSVATILRKEGFGRVAFRRNPDVLPARTKSMARMVRQSGAVPTLPGACPYQKSRLNGN